MLENIIKRPLLTHLLSTVIVVCAASPAFATGNQGDLILNEFNAVSDTNFLEQQPPGNADPFFGPVLGNGGNWVELVVARDHINIQGWTLQWDNADPDQGTVTFTSDAIWRDLRAGTIITIRETDGNFGPLPSNISYNPAGGDFTIHVDIDDARYVTQTGFKVDNDDWRMRIVDERGTVIQDYVGESQPLWAGSGVNSQEVGKLEQDPSPAAAFSSPVPNYQDGNSSSFGAPNTFNDGANQQNFTALREQVVPRVPALPVGAAASLALSLLGLSGGVVRRKRNR